MFDRYDPRDDDRDDRDRGRDLDRGGRGGGDAPDRRERDPRDVFTRDLDLPRGRERERAQDRDRVCDIDGSEGRMLATVGSFRVVAERDLAALRDDARKSHQSIRHLEDEGLIRRSPLDANDRAVVLTDRGRDLLEANRSLPRDERTHEPRQGFYAGLRKPRELTHDVKVYRAYERAERRIREEGGRVQRVVLDYEMKRDYQRFLHERNRGRKDCDGRPDREADEIVHWAKEHNLPYEEDGHVHFPDARIEYEDRDGRSRFEDLEIVTPHYRGAHAAGAAKSGFTCYVSMGSGVGGRGGGRGGRSPRIMEEFL
jgi:DNA-binding MarR family transcriptional regulator